MNQRGKAMKQVLAGLIVLLVATLAFGQGSDELIKAYDLFQKGEYQSAFDICKPVVDADPNYAGAVFLLGRIYYGMGDLDNAKIYVDKAIELDRANTEYRDVRNTMAAFISKLSEASRLVASADYQGAKKIYLEIINENKNFAEAYFSLGIVFVRLQDYSSAAEYMNKAIQMKPTEEKYRKSFQCLVSQVLAEGTQLMQRKNYPGALEKFQQAISLDSNDYRSYYLSAVISLDEKNYTKALEFISRCIEKNPNNPKAFLVLGKAQTKLNNVPEALKAFEAATNIDQQYLDGWVNIGQIYYQLKDFSNAIPALNKVVEINANYETAYELLGAIHTEMNNFKDAVTTLSKAVQLDPKSTTSWLRLATAQNKLGQCQEAKESANSALKLKINWAPALIELGIAERCLGNKAAAKQAFQLAGKDLKWKSVAEFELKTVQ